MKFKIFTVAALALALTVTGAIFPVTSSAASSDNYVKIGLKYASSDKNAELSSDEGLSLCKAGNDDIDEGSDKLDGYGDIRLTLKNGKITVSDQRGNRITELKGDGTECIISAGFYDSNDYISYDGSAYRGGIIPYINSSGQLNIINYVRMDDYIKGVLHKEMSQSSNLEALKAQAVTARSYAEFNRNKHKKQGFDLCASSHCQNYIGVKGEYPSTNEAVESTAGQMLYYDGEVVAGYYFANSGGHTENSEDVWGGRLGYLRGVPDAYSPEYTWKETFSRSQLNNMFASEDLGTISSISIDSVNSSGYVSSLTVNGTNKSVVYKKDKIRSAFHGNRLRSRMFSFDAEGASLSSGTSGGSQGGNSIFYSISSAGKRLLSNAFTVLTSNGTVDINLNGLKILDGSGNITTAAVPAEEQEPVSQAGTVTFKSNSDKLIINGRGWGHGVGMSQQGAIEMGRQGYGYQDILKYYYTDIEVK